MGNKQRGLVDVTLDGATHQLRYNLNSLAEIEDRLKLDSISQILDTLRNLSMRTLRTLLWAGLIHAQPDLTEQEVGAMDFDFSGTVAKVSEAISAVFKSDDDEAQPEGNAPRPARGAGAKR